MTTEADQETIARLRRELAHANQQLTAKDRELEDERKAEWRLLTATNKSHVALSRADNTAELLRAVTDARVERDEVTRRNTALQNALALADADKVEYRQQAARAEMAYRVAVGMLGEMHTATLWEHLRVWWRNRPWM